MYRHLLIYTDYNSDYKEDDRSFYIFRYKEGSLNAGKWKEPVGLFDVEFGGKFYWFSPGYSKWFWSK